MMSEPKQCTDGATEREEHYGVRWLDMQADPTITKDEFFYLFDIQYRHGGHFKKALYEAIARADESNKLKLALGFPGEVRAYEAWTQGDLARRAEKYGVC